MREVKAIIQPFMANHVLDVLNCIRGVSGVTASDVRCTDAIRGTVNPNIKIELMLRNELVAEVLAAIQTHAYTGRRADGCIFVTDVQRTISIRSGECDD